MIVKNRLHKILSDRGVTGIDFARQIAFDPAHLNRIKNGRVVPQLHSAMAIARGLGVSVEDVFYVEERG